MAEFIPPELDPESRASIDALHKRALTEADEAIAARTMESVGSERGLIDNPAAKMRDSGLNPEGDDGAMLQAINQRATHKYDQSIRALDVKSRHEAKQSSMNRKMRAVELLSKEQAHNEQIRQMKEQAAASRRAARAATLGSIMGIAGAVGGAMVGGAPGAMAGFQIGGGVGTQVGQNQPGGE